MYGFSGREQLESFVQAPFLNSHLLKRFNNSARTLIVAISSSATTEGEFVVMEELLISLLHYETMEWLLPKVQPARAELMFVLNISATLKLGPNGIKLKSVRLNWDHGSVLSQSGALLEGLKIVSRKSSTPEEILESDLKCVEGKKLKMRLEYPTPNNISSFSSKITYSEGHYMKRNPINERTELSMEAEPPTQSNISPVRKHPAMTSEFFSSPEPPVPNFTAASKPNPALQSNFNLGTAFTPIPAEKKAHPPTRNIFFSDSPLPPNKPSVVIDCKRLESKIVAPEEDKPIVPLVPSLDENRFRSTWSESDMSEDSPLPVKTSIRILNPKRFESHIFSPEVTLEHHQKQQQQPVKHAYKANEMLLGQGELDDEIKFNVKMMDPHRFKSSINFSETPVAQENHSPVQKQQSSIQIGTYDSPSVMAQKREHAKQAINSRAYSSHKSTLAFDFDNPIPSPPKNPSTR